MHIRFPEKGTNVDDLLREMDDLSAHDADWRKGRTFSLVFYPGEQVAEVGKRAYTRFFMENALSPASFRSLSRMESEVVSMTASLLHAPAGAVGNMTSGGTESILCAVRAAIAFADSRIPDGHKGNLVMPETAHPAFNKAADYFGLELRIVPGTGDALCITADAMAQHVDDATVMMVASAPAYPHGIIDPVEEIGKLASRLGIWLHVDACVGGFLIPFIERIDEPVMPFDFRVEGVCSISLDLHKYAYAPKGASVIIYREPALRKGQYYVYSKWAGGLYASPSVSGTRSGGAIAAAWAVMRHMGAEGYADYARQTLHASRKIQQTVNQINGIRITGEPLLPVFSIMSDGKVDIYRLGDALSARGWHLDRQLSPPSLHLSVTFGNVAFVDEFIADLRSSVAEVTGASMSNLADMAAQKAATIAARVLPESWVRSATKRSIDSIPDQKSGSTKTAPLYGMVGELSGKGTVDDMLRELLDAMNRPPAAPKT